MKKTPKYVNGSTKNNYVHRLTVNQAAREYQLTRQTVTRCLDIAALVLNEKFGFGADRITDFANGVNEMFDEYMSMTDSGVDYADTKVTQRLEQIMGRKKA